MLLNVFFLVPKPKRNFLRENKLKIREIQHKQSLPPDKFSKGSRVSSSSVRSDCICPCNCGDVKTRTARNAPANDILSGGHKTHGCVTKTIKVCDQEIQTEEINDENFLLASLKNCTSNEVQSLVLKDNCEEYNDEVLSQNFQNIEINPHLNHHNGMNSDRMTTSRSTGTMYSNGGKGKRDIKLPRYLEKEKRDKEQQRLKEELKDPNCPPGHYALENVERESLLKSAEKSKYNFSKCLFFQSI